MKIHGKILNHYLSCGTPVDKEGYLYKKGEVNTSYQKRWFTLKGNLLFYRDRPGDREVLGVIVLEGCAVQLCDSEEPYAFSLVFSGSGLRTYKFSAENQANQEGWVKAIHSASHSFLSILQQDLHQQYLDVVKAAGVKPADSSHLVRESVLQSQKPYLASVFYTQNPAPGLKGLVDNQLLQAPPTTDKSAGKRSPRLWPKRHAHVTPLNGPAPPLGEWTDPTEDFSKMHEDFGREVRRLVADWRKRGQALPERDLIDLG